MGRERSDVLRRMQYISMMRPMFQTRAVFSDETEFYRKPMQPKPHEDCTVRIRTMKNNVDEVYFISGSKREKMTLAETVGGFDFYEHTESLTDETVRYYFELRVESTVCYYNKLGITRNLADRYSFRIVPGFVTPDWSHGAVMYQIYTDRFYNGDKTNDVETREYCYLDKYSREVKDWNHPPEDTDIWNFYGGDLEGIRQKLDYLQELGVEVLYLNPIFVSPSNHKYDTQDYDHIDPHIGKIVNDGGDLLMWDDHNNRDATKYILRTTDPENLAASDKLFEELCAELHRRGMRIIIDGVFNHCGSFNKWLDRECIYEDQHGYAKGAFVDRESPYYTFFKFNNEHSWPYNEFYDGWWGHKTLPKLNYEESPELVDYIMNIGKKWVSAPYNADGWRLDVAADLGQTLEYNHKFWRKFRQVVKKANPDAIVLAEHYGESAEWLLGDQWDTVMNYDAFMEPVSWFFTGMEKHSDHYRADLIGNGESFESAMRYHLASFIGSSALCAMNELDNHDHSRFLTRTNHLVGRVAELGSDRAGENVDPSIMRAAVVIQMTFVGAPTLYYGDEAGVVGFTDPDNRRTYPWGREDKEMLEFYQAAIQMHKEHKTLRNGSLKFLGCGYQYISYGRFSDKDQFVIVANSGYEPVPVELPVWETGITRNANVEMVEIFVTDADGFSTEPKKRLVTGGVLTLDLRPHEAVVLYHAGVGEE
ncbi:MAG: glycoside hydrolase family 13 protein [Lachnospiraceae bacterium]|nr:glycoside hydrolase family 13 protein [Lachnospiraceae bacterium]